MKKFLLAAVATLAIVAFAASAEARPGPGHHEPGPAAWHGGPGHHGHHGPPPPPRFHHHHRHFGPPPPPPPPPPIFRYYSYSYPRVSTVQTVVTPTGYITYSIGTPFP